MKAVKDIATLSEIEIELKTLDLELIFADMVTYARYRIKGGNLIDSEKIVGDVFEKVIAGIRKWNKDYSFRSFLFGSVKSLVYQYNKQFLKKVIRYNYDVKVENIPDSTMLDNNSFEELKKITLKLLKKNVPPPDEIEEMVFICWMDEIKKPIDIAKFWEIDIKAVYKAIKRLERKLTPVRELLNS